MDTSADLNILESVGAHRHAPFDTRDLRQPICFRRSTRLEGVQRYAPTRPRPIAADNRLVILRGDRAADLSDRPNHPAAPN